MDTSHLLHPPLVFKAAAGQGPRIPATGNQMRRLEGSVTGQSRSRKPCLEAATAAISTRLDKPIADLSLFSSLMGHGRSRARSPAVSGTSAVMSSRNGTCARACERNPPPGAALVVVRVDGQAPDACQHLPGLSASNERRAPRLGAMTGGHGARQGTAVQAARGEPRRLEAVVGTCFGRMPDQL
jgi:hypothetical protein